jgi:transposase-like protein
MTDWNALKAEYIRGGTSYRKLAEKHGVSFNTLKTVAIREKWTDLRQQTSNTATTKLVDKIGGQQASRSAKILDVADKLLNKISITIDTMDVVDSQSLKHFTSALKDLKDIKGIKSEIDLKEQEARIAKLQKEAMADENQDKEIRVTIEGGLDEYSK